ncbi:MAG: diguanylate cyclase [Candidatus Velthaea sp.]|jgi:diguanylate cyclase (GGDEF)-like protein
MIHPAPGSRPAGDTSPAIGPIEIAPRIWWVGCSVPGDRFQCHSYLIEHGDQSVLLDPGSVLTWPQVRRQVDAIVGLHNVRYFVCHHPDPDIAASLPAIDAQVTRSDAVVVTQWRAEELLKHYGLSLSFWRVEEHEWRLDLGGRRLRFVSTPYCHFPGAFVTLDEATGTLFSSDLFGGFCEPWSLYAQDEQYFEQMRPFHEHYMPSREILGYTLARLEQLPIDLIAPQHGSIIPKRLTRFMIERLKELECGIYLITDETTDIRRLSKLNRALHDVTETLMMKHDFADLGCELLEIVRRYLPARSLECFAAVDRGEVLALVSEHRYHGMRIPMPPALAPIFGTTQTRWTATTGASFAYGTWPLGQPDGEPTLIVPLFSPMNRTAEGVAIVRLERSLQHRAEVDALCAQFSAPLQVAVDRQRVLCLTDLARENSYQQAIRDPLTGLFTRLYMAQELPRLCALQDRGAGGAVGLIMLDIDWFKTINDRFGHMAGDAVLVAVAKVFLQCRASDVPVRFGGDEFAIFTVGADNRTYAERLRAQVAQLTISGSGFAGASVTVSCGVASRARNEPIDALITRADRALYRAKQNGRNRGCCDVEE